MANATVVIEFSKEQMEELKTHITKVRDSIVPDFLSHRYTVCLNHYPSESIQPSYVIRCPDEKTVLEKSYKTIQEANYEVKILNAAYDLGYSLGVMSK